jgi:hypothetical protein
MKEFLKSIEGVSLAMLKMFDEWQKLDEQSNERVQKLDQWAEAFNLSLDEIPFVLFSVVDELSRGK